MTENSLIIQLGNDLDKTTKYLRLLANRTQALCRIILENGCSSEDTQELIFNESNDLNTLVDDIRHDIKDVGFVVLDPPII